MFKIIIFTPSKMLSAKIKVNEDGTTEKGEIPINSRGRVKLVEF